MNLGHALFLFIIGMAVWFYGGLWLLAVIERWRNRRNRERMKW